MLISHLRNIRERIDKINPLVLAIMLFSILLILCLPTYNCTSARGDLGEYINNPVRIMYGDLPYRDFWLLFPPGEVFFPFFIYKLFGVNVNFVLLFSLIVSIFVVISSFFLGRLIFKNNFFALLVAILVFFNGILTLYIGPTYIHIHLLLLFLSAFFFVRYLERNNIKELFLAGILIGLAFFFKLEVVCSALVAFSLILIIYSNFNKKPFNYYIKSLAIFFIGILLVLSFIFIAFIEIWPIMLKAIAIESVSHAISATKYSSTSIELIVYWNYFFGAIEKIIESGDVFYLIKAFYRLTKLVNVAFSYLLPFLLISISLWYFWSKKLKNYEKIIVLFFLLWGILTLPKALTLDMSHLTPSLTPLFFLLVFFFQKSSKYDNKILKYGLFFVILILLTSVPLFLGKIVVCLKICSFEVSAPGGTLLFFNELEAKEVNEVIHFVNKNTDEGDYIFVVGWEAPPFYALTNRRNPTYYDSLIDVEARPSEEKEKNICNNLLKKNVKLIIYYASFESDKKEFTTLNSLPILQTCIKDNFELVKKQEYCQIYLPRKKMN